MTAVSSLRTASEREENGGRIPVTVLGGFLGAGKTSLLNHMLSNAVDRRWAVLVNDFGAINIDATLVQSRDGDVLSLANGCVCCQIGDDLSDALIRVMGSDVAPDAIVIEASGVSDPWRIAQVGLADPALALEGVIVLVDAACVQDHHADPLLRETVQRQLDAADLLVLNKCDQVDRAGIVALHAWLDRHAPNAQRFETVDGKVPQALLRDPLVLAHARGAAESGGVSATHEVPEHGAVFETWQWRVNQPLNAERVRALLKNMPAGTLRLKGIIQTDRHPAAVVQFAGRRGSLRAQPVSSDMSGARIVAIGAVGTLPVEALERAWQQTVHVDLRGLFSQEGSIRS